MSAADGRWALESRCLYPGHWKIEGHHVIRQPRGRGRRRPWWTVEDRYTDQPTVVLHEASTLAACRDWIADH